MKFIVLDLSKKIMACMSGGYIFSPIMMKLGQNVCLDKISEDWKLGHVWSKTRSTGHILEKHCVCSGGHISF